MTMGCDSVKDDENGLVMEQNQELEKDERME